MTLTVDNHVDLGPFNTLAVPARAKYFTQLDSLDQIDELIDFLSREQLPLLLLGGGSNVVLADDFSGLAVKLNLLGVNIQERGDQVLVSAMAGENWHALVEHCLSNNIYGLENLALIPGTVGAAPIQNIGAYGVELESVFHSLDAVDLKTGERKTFSKVDCQFGYRDSIFKNAAKDRYVITRVNLSLSKTPASDLRYPALQQALEGVEKVTPQAVFDAVCRVRASKLPDPKDIPNAGSFFKNPVIANSLFETLKQAHPEMPGYPQANDCTKLAAGWLIDQSGWKAKPVGRVQMHALQALVLTNPNCDSGQAILTLARAVQADILQRFGVTLEIEPRVYGCE